MNKSVAVKSCGTDRYGCTLGIVFVEGANVNLEMLKVGLAEVYRGRPARGLDMDTYWNTEADAKNAGVGMWALGDRYISPREWRRSHKKR